MAKLPPVRGINVQGLHITFVRWLEEVRRLILVDSDAGAPTGSLVGTLATVEPDAGWLLCNGQSVSQRTYAELFAVIGTTYGGTATEFTIPDLTDRTVIGAGAIALLGLGGANSITLAEAQLPAHTHAVTDPGHTHSVTDPGHTHSMTAENTEAAQSGTNATAATSGGTTGSATTGLTVDSATTGVTVGNTGSGAAVDITPKAIGVNWLIKT